MDNFLTAVAAATDHGEEEEGPLVAPPPAKKARKSRSKKGGDISREKRLEQNRKAAIESRRRKKAMVSCNLATLCSAAVYGDVHQMCFFLFFYLANVFVFFFFNPSCVHRSMN